MADPSFSSIHGHPTLIASHNSYSPIHAPHHCIVIYSSTFTSLVFSHRYDQWSFFRFMPHCHIPCMPSDVYSCTHSCLSWMTPPVLSLGPMFLLSFCMPYLIHYHSHPYRSAIPLLPSSCPTLASFKCSICVTSFCTSAHCLLHHIYFLNTPPHYPIRSYSYYSWCFAFLESASLSSKIYFIVVGLSPSFSKLYRVILGLCNDIDGGGRGLRILN